MDYNMMNFRDFINPTRKPVPKAAQMEDVEEDFEPKEVQKSVRPAPQRRVPPKVVKQYEEPEEYDGLVDEDEEYYEEPVVYVQPQRPVQRPVQRVQVRPQPRPQPRPVARPTRPVHNGYAMPDAEFRRPLTVSPKQLKENTIEGTANSLTEAIKRKVDTVFYRFGIQGLEKLDEKILDTIEELQYPEQKQTKRPLREMRRQPVRKPVKKYRPLPLEEVPPVPPVYEGPVYQEPISYEDPIDDEPIEETAPEAISEPPVEEIVEEPIEPPPPPKKVVASPKPSFLQPKKVEKPTQIESTGDEDEDLINAAMSMDFSESVEEQKPVVSDEEIWGEVEAILETEPSQKLVHEPQTQSQLMIPPTQVEEQVEAPEVQEQPTEEPKPKKKRKKTEETKVEENTTNEKE